MSHSISHANAPDPQAQAGAPVAPAARVPEPLAGPLTPSAVLGLQRSHGNAYVQRLLAPARGVQRDGPAPGGAQLQPPTLGSGLGWRPPAPAGPQLRLDPEIEAQIRAIEAMRQLMAPAPMTTALGALPLPAIPPHLLTPPDVGGSPAPAPAPAPAAPAAPDPGPRPGTELQGPRAGEAGDIWRGMMSDKIIGPAVVQLGDLATMQAKMDWKTLKTGEKAAVVSTSVLLVGGALTGLLANPAGRSWAMTTLNDKILPVPYLTGLSAQFNLGGDHIIMGLHLDVGKFLPASLGFGPGVSPSPLGSPPNPYEPPPGQGPP